MVSIIFTIVFGLAIGYFAIQNTSPVTIQFGVYVVENLPLYVVAIGSLVLGLLIAWIFYAFRTISNWTFTGASHWSRSRRTAADLDRERDLEVENARLKTELASSRSYTAAAHRDHEPTRHSNRDDFPPL